ncbi:hypothetical protein LR48_Vigan2370s000100 [Vigna angularis]|uniref:Uncharacterized protein n=1 Tax=Vigna angularis var. angularis TaxID=157739 RepID=A0A0S3RMG7_PHAAN|nr:hypothetical protein LR48_Vigan2370s000100 [Vigna angularis]BAT81774.1 hypothetical protein VIGAN_03163300 [Vigna angularis var. angularis]
MRGACIVGVQEKHSSFEECRKSPAITTFQQAHGPKEPAEREATLGVLIGENEVMSTLILESNGLHNPAGLERTSCHIQKRAPHGGHLIFAGRKVKHGDSWKRRQQQGAVAAGIIVERQQQSHGRYWKQKGATAGRSGCTWKESPATTHG